VLPLFDNVPTRRLPVVTWALIGANFAVWLWELGGRSSHIDDYAFYPCAVSGPCVGAARSHLAWPEGTVTGMFLHASWLHILGNMLFLWIFGNNVEDVMGRLRFIVFYLGAGFAAALAQTWVTLHYAGVGAASVPNVGASGAIAGVLGAYFLLLPRASVLTAIFLGFFFILRQIPAIFFLGIWIALQALDGTLSLTTPQAGGGVAFFAHIGGFAFGILTVHLVKVRRPLQPTSW